MHKKVLCRDPFLRSAGAPDPVMEPIYLLFIFLAGGSMVAGTTYIAELIDPKYGGILAVAPIITTLAFLFTSMHSTQERTQDLILGSIAFLIPTALFLVSLYLLLGRYGIVASIIGSYGVWLIAVVIVARLAGLM
jgi:uncharacterized membrane protein (GlpM family)